MFKVKNPLCYLNPLKTMTFIGFLENLNATAMKASELNIYLFCRIYCYFKQQKLN